ncbi:hypothetical protein TPY_2754 [Sulfobacillus acidophilus TPY]|uniref:Uncharacterized protein n=1 Tax=Sulfobacillus acidophilus (strain ATCC 700253 / DSM 10332 / NAL) TaxID=679936 RepID=G8TUH9_SULAD|nr:hypothetical protein TPY_2754 [Sulfobacillus acidophilus TPY]AEW04626.1 hypothetical protein Sulac_1126 [Sulfobacillus acidophilus DSM 10332]
MNPKPSITHKLMAVARQLARMPETDTRYQPTMEQLMDMVERAVDQGIDHVIERAIERLHDEHAHDAAELVAFWADEYASAMPVQIIMNPSGPPRWVEQLLFVVPIVLVQPLGEPVPRGMPSGAAWDRFVQSFRHHGLIEQGPSLFLAPVLYTADELPQTWSARRHWGAQLLQQILDQSIDFTINAASSTAAIIAPNRQIALRFLVGGVLLTDDDAAPAWEIFEDFEDTETDDADESTMNADIVHDQLQAWLGTVKSLIDQWWPSVQGFPGWPGRWDVAQETARHLWNVIGLQQSLEQAEIIGGGIVEVETRWDASLATWCVAIKNRKPESNTEWVWALDADGDDEREILDEILRASGIKRRIWDETTRDEI